MKRLEWPPRIERALLPTRIERLPSAASGASQVDLWIKRDDLTGFLLSGNKSRKLEFTFARALAEGAHGVVTCGGFNSNHCRATAAFAAELGIEAHLLLRTPTGAPPQSWQGNTLLDALLGARITWIDPRQYTERDRLLRDYAESRARRGRRLFVIPEGASDAIGALGYVKACEEMAAQLEAQQLEFDLLVHAVGSGGTTAGLTAGSAFFGLPWRVLGFAVCDDRAYFEAKVKALRSQMEFFGLPRWSASENCEIIDSHKGRGYGLTTPEELREIGAFCRRHGVVLDPCYTGKAYAGMLKEIAAGRIAPGSRILFLHTGGAFGNFSYADEWGAHFAAEPIIEPQQAAGS